MGAFSDSDEEEGGEAGAALEQGFFGQAVLPEDFKAKGLRMSVGLVDGKPVDGGVHLQEMIDSVTGQIAVDGIYADGGRGIAAGIH